MKKLRTKQFQILTDINLVWDFLTDIYDRENGSGVAAPFFEHAILASWMDNSYSYLNRFWLDGDTIAAFVFYEAQPTDIYFSVRKGYEFLADEMIEYAMTAMPDWEEMLRKTDEGFSEALLRLITARLPLPEKPLSAVLSVISYPAGTSIVSAAGMT